MPKVVLYTNTLTHLPKGSQHQQSDCYAKSVFYTPINWRICQKLSTLIK